MKTFLLLSGLLCSISVNAQCSSSPNVVTYSYDGRDYELVQETLTWEQAADCAVSRGGYLAHINSQEEHDSLYAWLSTDPAIDPTGTIDVFGASSIWLGGTDKANEGDWIWDGNNTDVGASFWSGNFNGTTVGGSFSAWGVQPPEPDNSGGNQNYLTWRLSGNNVSLWNDLHTSGGLFFLVEVDPNSASLEEVKNEAGLKVFPIPFESEITVELNAEQQFTRIDVSAVSGTSVISKSFEPTNSIDLDVSELPEGVYVLTIILENGSSLHREIIR